MDLLAIRSYFLAAGVSLVLGFTNASFAQQGSPTLPAPESEKKPTPKQDAPSFDELLKAYPKEGERLVISGPGNTYSMGVLRNDHRVSDVVAYVDVIERRLVDQIGEVDCESDRGGGYCAYVLTANVIEVFKGNVSARTLEFIGTSDATYPKKGFMGKKVVFLVWSEPERGRKPTLGTIENSSRPIEYDLLSKMRTIANPGDSIDETDVEEPYSRVSIREQFNDAEAVAYVDVISFRQDKDDLFGTGGILKARIREVFKGNLRVGQTVEYRQDLLYRKARAEDRGPRVVYLRRNDDRGGHYEVSLDKKTGKRIERLIKPKETVTYESEKYIVGFIRHNILEKLREISAASK